MTAQEIFEKVAKHLITQNARSQERSVGEDDNPCLYRNNRGLACAIGCLIPDGHYIIREYNNRPIIELMHKLDITFLLPRDIASDQDKLYFLRKLQDIHDFEPISNWPSYLRKFAAEFNLVVPEFLRVT